MIKRNISLIVTNQFLTALSDSIFSLAIMWYVYEITKSALSASLIMVIISLTGIIVGPFIGVLVDRREPKTSMQIGYACMILVGIILAIVYFYFVDILIVVIYLSLVVHHICMMFISPAKNKLLPRIVGVSKIVKVNGYIYSTSQTADLIGQAISGVLIGIIGFVGVMLFHSGVYLLASILLIFVINVSLVKDKIQTEEESTVTPKTSMLAELKAGMLILKQNRPIFKLVFLATALNATTIAGALFVVLVSDHYGASAVQFGLINAVAAVSGIIIGLVANKLTNFAKPYLVMAITLGISGVAFLSMGLTSNFYFGTLFFMMMTASIIIFSIIDNTLMIVLVKDEFRGRVFMLKVAIASLLIPIFSLAGGLIADSIPVNYLFIFGGCWVLICSLFPLFDRDIRAIERLPREE
ncbi:MFS transporter [Sporosarcina limicola]|uniref:MFS family permease n=1 Tax=Sporosarcina limicola TaxID=34101 RepID=A0A927MIY0_9BACL|nr:MFS transporter [Sporosarcina limicola]MBE1555250.1 MFS family permease [Sporosarcina limicola]